ncbi:MAG TPA: class I SAM-dependent methyltransferase [Baekduia sp.]|uniref:class I SAM-dependent methyltransferase n=1 Tax=Baekduia sp. TaxID=2600305 RepID=UPI002D784022|nr:class I SAM-dependent methyltransferase [Baekduia sp.]HET6505474.1 class I SAM-dependent methyltransferase [Baekduia sp.]
MTSTLPITPEQLKDGHRVIWASGDYAAVADTIDEALPAALLAELPPLSGADVLDVATGTGNLAVRAASAGARRTVGLDLVPELLDVARAREHADGVEWVVGDAERLPFGDGMFDVVASVVGIQFAPRHQVVAGELLRVLRPGGTLGLVNWTPAGLVGQMFAVLGRHLPAPPAFASPPPLWGDPDHVAALLDGGVGALTARRGVNTFRAASADAFADFFEDNYGPIHTARNKLGDAWAPCGDGLREVYERLGRRTDDGPGWAVDSEFVVITARRA